MRFSLTPEAVAATKQAAQEAKQANKSLVIVVDLDDTMLWIKQSLAQGKPVINHELAALLAELCLELGPLANFYVLSSRAEDLPAPNISLAVGAQLALEAFEHAVNAAIREKNSSSTMRFAFNKENIYFLKTATIVENPQKVKRVVESKKVIVIERDCQTNNITYMLVSQDQANEMKAKDDEAQRAQNNALPYVREYSVLGSSNDNKGQFFKLFLLPQLLAQPDKAPHRIVFIDDMQSQRDAVAELNSIFLCIPISVPAAQQPQQVAAQVTQQPPLDVDLLNAALQPIAEAQVEREQREQRAVVAARVVLSVMITSITQASGHRSQRNGYSSATPGVFSPRTRNTAGQQREPWPKQQPPNGPGNTKF